MINVTVNELLASVASFNELMKYKLSPKNCYTISLLIREVNKELETIQVVMKKTVEKYGTPDSSGKVLIPDDSKSDFNAEMQPFLASVIAIQADPFSISVLDDLESLTPELMMPLLPFITKI